MHEKQRETVRRQMGKALGAAYHDRTIPNSLLGANGDTLDHISSSSSSSSSGYSDGGRVVDEKETADVPAFDLSSSSSSSGSSLSALKDDDLVSSGSGCSEGESESGSEGVSGKARIIKTATNLTIESDKATTTATITSLALPSGPPLPSSLSAPQQQYEDEDSDEFDENGRRRYKPSEELAALPGTLQLRYIQMKRKKYDPRARKRQRADSRANRKSRKSRKRQKRR